MLRSQSVSQSRELNTVLESFIECSKGAGENVVSVNVQGDLTPIF